MRTYLWRKTESRGTAVCYSWITHWLGTRANYMGEVSHDAFCASQLLLYSKDPIPRDPMPIGHSLQPLERTTHAQTPSSILHLPRQCIHYRSAWEKGIGVTSLNIPYSAADFLSGWQMFMHKTENDYSRKGRLTYSDKMFHVHMLFNTNHNNTTFLY